MVSGGESEVLVAIARLDGKLDLTLAEITALKAGDADHEVRLRAVEAAPVPDPETASRLKALEDRRTISPGQLWAGLLGASALAWTVTQLADKWSQIFGG